MKTQVINSIQSETFMPEKHTIIIRITSNESFAVLQNRSAFQDVLELRFDDISDTHPKEDSMLYGAMTKEQFWEIVEFINRNKNTGISMIIHCDAGQSRSPAIAISVLDYLLEEQTQAQDLIRINTHWKPNSFVTSFFRTAYYNREI